MFISLPLMVNGLMERLESTPADMIAVAGEARLRVRIFGGYGYLYTRVGGSFELRACIGFIAVALANCPEERGYQLVLLESVA